MIKTGRVREHLRIKNFYFSKSTDKREIERGRVKSSQVENQIKREIKRELKRYNKSSEISRTIAETRIAIS